MYDNQSAVKTSLGPPLPARPSAIGDAMSRLRNAVESAESLSDATNGRLQDILCPVQPPPTSIGDAKDVPAGALAEAINQLATRIYADNRRRNEMLERLEL